MPIQQTSGTTPDSGLQRKGEKRSVVQRLSHLGLQAKSATTQNGWMRMRPCCRPKNTAASAHLEKTRGTVRPARRVLPSQ
jgi:hypothetical protein